MPRRWIAAAVLLIALTGCGPTLPLNAGVAVRGVNVFFGTPAPIVATPQPLPPFTNPNPAFPFPLESAPPPVGLATPAAPCPALSPIAAAAVPASFAAPSAPPAAATYPFRFAGTWTTGVNTSHQTTKTIPSAGTRTVGNVRPVSAPNETGAFSFTVTQQWGDLTTVSSFTVLPQGPTGGSAEQAGTPAAGMYLTQMTDNFGDVFNPGSPGVQVMAYPSINSNTWSSSEADPAHNTTMEIFDPSTVKPPPTPGVGVPGGTPPTPYGGTATGEALVNACGTAVDSIGVKLVGTLVNSSDQNQSKNFTLWFNDAPQFGGLIVADHLQETGTDETTNTQFQYDVTATIDVVPKAGS